jgi:hypothetical protein
LLPVVDHSLQVLDNSLDVVITDVEGCGGEPDDVGGSEVGYHPPGHARETLYQLLKPPDMRQNVDSFQDYDDSFDREELNCIIDNHFSSNLYDELFARAKCPNKECKNELILLLNNMRAISKMPARAKPSKKNMKICRSINIARAAQKDYEIFSKDSRCVGRILGWVDSK